MNPTEITPLAEATKAVAETAGKAIDVATSLGNVIKGSVTEIFGMLEDQIKVFRWQRRVSLTDKAQAIMAQRGLVEPTRALPLSFAVPLLTHAIIEEDDDLQKVWATLLVNAGDSTSPMELRVAYVELLRGMSAYDVQNLSVLAKASLSRTPHSSRAVEVMRVLRPDLCSHGKPSPEVPFELGVSLANLGRLGCAMPGGGMDGAVLYNVMTVTDLGVALVKACSVEEPIKF